MKKTLSLLVTGEKGGCNVYGGSYSVIESGKVDFLNIFSTKMFCENASRLESSYFQSLEEANTAKI